VDTEQLGSALVAEGIPSDVVAQASGYAWANGPGDRYGAHRHDYDKVLLCLEGGITFGLPETGRTVRLAAGERLDLPAGTLHDALVGAGGVRCYETHLPAGVLAARPHPER
jgi:quercetin dioxygenase-like cupin family protein